MQNFSAPASPPPPQKAVEAPPVQQLEPDKSSESSGDVIVPPPKAVEVVAESVPVEVSKPLEVAKSVDEESNHPSTKAPVSEPVKQIADETPARVVTSAPVQHQEHHEVKSAPAKAAALRSKSATVRYVESACTSR